MTAATATMPVARDAEVIAVVAIVHSVSHFFQLLLPALFPWLIRDFGLTYTEAGGTVTAFFVVSGAGQASAGFLVDRFGAARVLAGGIVCFVAAALCLAAAHSYAALIASGIIAGLGNSVFHPADFTVLNRRVATARLGHAFSMHGLSGNLGWAAAPLLLTTVASLAGWRIAALVAGGIAVGALVLLLLVKNRLDVPLAIAQAKGRPGQAHAFSFLRAPAVWMCFGFFLLISIGFGAIQSFAPSILHQIYGLTLASAASTLSAYMLGSAGGTLVGGFLVRHAAVDRIVAGVLAAAALLAILLSTGLLPAWGVLPLMVVFGFCTGAAGPSRDLMVRQAATARFGEAAYGRVYGFVYSGLDTGIALAPMIFGQFMDGGRFSAVLVGVAVAQTLAILTALSVGQRPAANHGSI